MNESLLEPDGGGSDPNQRVERLMRQPVANLANIALTYKSKDFRTEMIRQLQDLIGAIAEMIDKPGDGAPLTDEDEEALQVVPPPRHDGHTVATDMEGRLSQELRSGETNTPPTASSSRPGNMTGKRRARDVDHHSGRTKRPRTKGDPGTRTARTKKADTRIAITDSCDTADLKKLRKTFSQELVAWSHGAAQDGVEALSQSDVDDIASFFFDEIMGANTLTRLIKIIDAYSENHDRLETDAGARVRLAQIATDRDAPVTIRKFCGSFNRQEIVRQSVDPNLQHLQMIINSRELLAEYDRLREAARKRDPELVAYLRSKGLTQAIGKGWSSIAIDFLAGMIKIKRSTFKWSCEKARGLDCLVDEFGEGVLPLLPPGSIDKLRRFGIGRMRVVSGILKRTVGGFQDICDLTRQHIYHPFIEGADRLPLNSTKLSVHESKSFMKLISEAADVSVLTARDL